MLTLDFRPYTLHLNRAFRISQGVRSSAPLMFVKISFEGVYGVGEASMPPLYGESEVSATQFLQNLNFSQFKDPFDTETILNYVNESAAGNPAAKAAVDMALHDLVGKLWNVPARTLLGLPAVEMATSMTIGIDSPEKMAQRATELSDFKYLKIKLGTPEDESIISAIRQVTQQPFFIDANQGWKTKEEALDRVQWLKEQGTIFIEQPMNKLDKAGNAWITERSPLPIVGDEGVQRLSDLREVSSIYHGINIKLMKCTGIREGFKMAVTAKALGMKVMLGCMSETSCAIAAASQLVAMADWIDLDGHLDIANDPFQGATVKNGVLLPTSGSGLGIQNIKPVF